MTTQPKLTDTQTAILKAAASHMTNPFAPLQQRVNQVETVLRQMPPGQREQLLAEMLLPMPMHRPVPAIEPAVTMVTTVTFKVEEWDGGPVMQQRYSTVVLRPRRISRHIPWQWRWIAAGIRLTRIVRKSAKQQMKQFNKLQRQMIRRVLPRHEAMRGARARLLASDRPRNEVTGVTRVTGYHPGYRPRRCAGLPPFKEMK